MFLTKGRNYPPNYLQDENNQKTHCIFFRSNRQEVFCKIGVLRNIAKFTGKHLCQASFLIKLHAGPATLLKKRPWHRCFPRNFAKFLRTPFLIEHLWPLLLISVEKLLMIDVCNHHKTFTTINKQT